jgi:Sec-independent protein translocase protein TatA
MNSIAIKIAAALAVVALLFFAERYIEGRGYDRAMAEAQAQIQGIKREAAERLATETEKTLKAEQALQASVNKQNRKDSEHAQALANLSGRLHALADPAGRLRDPHAAGCGPGGGSPQGDPPTATGGGSGDPAQAGGLLSAELGGLLRRLTREADDINVAYASCRADAYTVRSAQP